jgi:hypothetical protein
MSSLREAMGAVWVAVLGVIVLFIFFVLTGAVDPGEVAWLTAAVCALALLATIHFVRVRHALADHPDDELARSIHAMRERRGF